MGLVMKVLALSGEQITTIIYAVLRCLFCALVYGLVFLCLSFTVLLYISIFGILENLQGEKVLQDIVRAFFFQDKNQNKSKINIDSHRSYLFIFFLNAKSQPAEKTRAWGQIQFVEEYCVDIVCIVYQEVTRQYLLALQLNSKQIA